jgi:drug/metabolite transporter (DMT)-like permease
MTTTKNTTIGVLLAMITGALWALVFLAPAMTSSFSPLMLVSARYIAYGILALGLMLFRLKGICALLTARSLGTAFGLAIAGNTLYYLLLANAIQMAGVPLSTLVIGFIPVTVALLGSLGKNARPVRRFWPALVLGAVAIVLISADALLTGASNGTNAPLIGLCLAIGALVCWTVFAVGNSVFLNANAVISPQDWNLILGVVTGLQGLLILPLAISSSALPSEVDVWLSFLFVTVVLALLSSLVANALWNQVSRLLPLTLIGPLVLFETLFALLYGFAWEQRLPNVLEGAAIVLLLASVILSVLAHRRPKASASLSVARHDAAPARI